MINKRLGKEFGKEYVKVTQKTIEPKWHLAEDPHIIQACLTD